MVDFRRLRDNAESTIFEGVKTALMPLTALGRALLRDDPNTEALKEINKLVNQGVKEQRESMRIDPRLLSLSPTQQAISAPADAVSTAAAAPPEGKLRTDLLKDILPQTSPSFQISAPGLQLRALVQGNQRLSGQKDLRRNLEKELGIKPGGLTGLDDAELNKLFGKFFDTALDVNRQKRQAKTVKEGIKGLLNQMQIPTQTPAAGSPADVSTQGTTEQPGVAGVQPQSSGLGMNPNLQALQSLVNMDETAFNNLAGTQLGQDFIKNTISKSFPDFKAQLQMLELNQKQQEFAFNQQKFATETGLKERELVNKENDMFLKQMELLDRRLISNLDRDAQNDRNALTNSTKLQVQAMKDAAAIAKEKAEKKKDATKQANTLRKEYIKADEEHQKRVGFYNQMVASAEDPDAISDLAMVITFMKMLDPESVVRETEQGMVIEARGISDSAKTMIERALNGETLTEEQRADILQRTNILYEKSLQVHENTVSEYTRLAKEFGVESSQVITQPLSNIDITGVPDSILAREPALRDLAIQQLESELGNK